MNELDNLLQVFKEIDNNLKNSMIENRIRTYNSDFDYNKLVKTIKEYIDNFNVLMETGDDELVLEIQKRASNILSSTKEEYFKVHSFTNDAIYLIDKVPNQNNSIDNSNIHSSNRSSSKIEDLFYKYLIDKEYPKNVILRNITLRVNQTHRIEYDFIIQDNSKNYIANIEIKSVINQNNIDKVIQSIQNRQLENSIFFLAIFIQDIQKFIYIELDNGKIIFLETFPAYNELIRKYTLLYNNDKKEWDNFILDVDFAKLSNIKKNKKDINYEEGEKVRVFLKFFAIYLQEKIPELKSYKWKLNQASTQPQWTDDNGFRLSFYKGDSLPKATQINITFWASWYGGIFIKDNENVIFSKPEIIDIFQKKYPNIEFVKDKQHIMAIHFKNGMPKENELIDAIKQLLDILENIKSLDDKTVESEVAIESGNDISIPSEIRIKNKSEIESVLGVKSIANVLSSVLIKQFDDSGMMIGVFGKWGRGKTHFSEKLWEALQAKKPDYKQVVFSAWKYQDTKASWAYLYENIFSAYLDDNTRKKTFINKLRFGKNKTWNKLVDNVEGFYIEKKKIFKINLQKHTWFPIISFALFFMIAFVWSFFIDKPAIVNYLIGTFGVLVIIKFIFFYFQQKPSAVNFYRKYFAKKSFGDYLGLQAEIENELTILLKTWIPIANDDEKIILFVDDIDRCNIEQVIDIVDGLRVILDNPEVHNRLIIITAIDETILKQALEHKYAGIKEKDDNKINEMYREYLEKIFIIGLKLNALNDKEIEEILTTILPKNLLLDNQNIDKNNDVTLDEKNDLVMTKSDNDIDLSTEKIDSIDVTQTIVDGNVPDNLAEINIHEKIYLLDAIKQLENSTPRKIKIFYYKYLIMKKLFDVRIREENLISEWNEDRDEKIMVDILINLANGKEVKDFNHKKNKNIFDVLSYTAEMVSVL